MKTLLKTALVVAGMATIAATAPALAQAPGPGWGSGPGFGRGFGPGMAQTMPERPFRGPMMMQRMQNPNGTWTCPRFGGQVAAVPGTKIPGVPDGTGPWWLQNRTTPAPIPAPNTN